MVDAAYYALDGEWFEDSLAGLGWEGIDVALSCRLSKNQCSKSCTHFILVFKLNILIRRNPLIKLASDVEFLLN